MLICVSCHIRSRQHERQGKSSPLQCFACLLAYCHLFVAHSTCLVLQSAHRSRHSLVDMAQHSLAVLDMDTQELSPERTSLNEDDQASCWEARSSLTDGGQKRASCDRMFTKFHDDGVGRRSWKKIARALITLTSNSTQSATELPVARKPEQQGAHQGHSAMELPLARELSQSCSRR